jgi:hypothetical protein
MGFVDLCARAQLQRLWSEEERLENKGKRGANMTTRQEREYLKLFVSRHFSDIDWSFVKFGIRAGAE